ncbi:hypothetical protein [Streptomyces indicus]|uniref:Uncharacterized protein n=1 Tax=Streptomyces indicus TaxID=417292 RepID=A0A1G8ZSA1_9ACTN|nr:hypothetical protein [Streptomyces indicus]SDK17938.1 hypothetical protein SAMN05421806_105164 [Streptomyces indicus]
MIRDLYNVRAVGDDGERTPLTPEGERGRTPLTPEEEQRARRVLFAELGNALADHGEVSFPAHTPPERLRLIEVGRALSAHWGIPVVVEPEDEVRMRLYLPGEVGGDGRGGERARLGS